MATQLLELEGIGNWVKVFENNKDNNEDFHGPGGAYTLDLVLGQEELDKLTESGSRLKPKLTDDGIAIRFKRKHVHPAGITELGGPPRVADDTGTKWDPNVIIGNGSKLKVFVSVYDTKLGKGTRLEAVQVMELAEYERDDSEVTGLELPF